MTRLTQRNHSFGQRISAILRASFSTHARCGKCSRKTEFLRHAALSSELIAQWELTPEWANWMELREGSRCAWCRCTLRSSQLAWAINLHIERHVGIKFRSLRSAFDNPIARRLKIAEINKAGNLHSVLQRCEGLRYSEFGSTAASVPSQDLCALTFADSSLDVVVTSDTLEHVPDVDLALREIHRVLAVGGAHVFTVPMVDGRATRKRAELRDGKTIHLLPQS